MAGFQLGNTIGLLLSPIIMSRTGIFGPFVIFGLFGFLWVLVWIPAISGTPGEHAQISSYELEYITKGQKLVKPQIGSAKTKKVPPFSKLLSKWPTWALISANAMHSWVTLINIYFSPFLYNSGIQRHIYGQYLECHDFFFRVILSSFHGCQSILKQ
jgi:ACS family sodium-dependent inorganic phosphate cotransporter